MKGVGRVALVEEIDAGNLSMAVAAARSSIDWLLARAERPILTTSFGEHSAVLIDLVVAAMPDIPVVWIDHGFHTHETYRFALNLRERFDLDLRVFAPSETPAWISATLGGVPDVGSPEHEEFTRSVKLQPFARALDELRPDAWLTGIRAAETALRSSLPRFSLDRRSIVKAAPLLDWSEADMRAYLRDRGLPSEPNYFDPTKGMTGRECGLHRSPDELPSVQSATAA